MPVLNLQVIASSDDASEAFSFVDLALDPLQVTSPNLVGFRFTGASIPQGATINSASLQLYCPDVSGFGDDLDGTITGEDGDNPSTFTSGSNDLSNRTKTTASVSWVASDTGDGWQVSPDLSSILQEIVDRAGFAGDAVVIFAEGQSANALDVTSYDGTPANAAKLDIDYSVASAGRRITAKPSSSPVTKKTAFLSTN